MYTIQSLKAELSTQGLGAYYDALSPFARNAVTIHPQAAEDASIPVGASKLGGLPDLPAGQAWPRHSQTDIPLSFVAQVNFAETAPFDFGGKLPKAGMLYFFYDCSMDGMPWGFDPADRDGWRVIFRDSSADLVRAPAPKELENGDNGVCFAAARMAFEATVELPSPESDLCDLVELPDDDDLQDAWWEWLEENGEETRSKLLGHSDNIQGGMERECEYVTNGIYCGDGSGYQTARALGLHKNAGHWNLLMQIDSVEDCGMMWGDVGRLYLWITDEDLAAQQFEKAWLILQCG